MNIADLLGLRPKSSTSIALRDALAQAEQQLAAASVHITVLETARGAMLLDGTQSDIDKHEADLAAARGDAERLAAMIDALPSRIGEAVERETAAGLDKLRASTEKQLDAGVNLLAEIFSGLDRVATLMEQHDEIAATIRTANERLNAGRRQRVQYPAQVFWPSPADEPRLQQFRGNVLFPSPRGNQVALERFNIDTSMGHWRSEIARAARLRDDLGAA